MVGQSPKAYGGLQVCAQMGVWGQLLLGCYATLLFPAQPGAFACGDHGCAFFCVHACMQVSYEHMGKAKINCKDGCRCASTIIDVGATAGCCESILRVLQR